MNNWICPKCNSNNLEGQRFCGKCGQQLEAVQQTAEELPPTIMGGYLPQTAAAPNRAQQHHQPNPQLSNPQQPNFQQPNYQRQNQYQQQNQSHQSQQSPPFQPQNFQQQTFNAQPSVKKSNLKLFLALGGVLGLFFLTIFGVLIWISLIDPYLTEQAFIKKEKERQTRADTTAPDSLLRSEFSGMGSGNTYRRVQTFNKMQILQASQYLTPELKQGAENVSDAAAAEYVSSKNSNLKVVTQVFKFNTPENAAAKCRQIGGEMQKRKDNLSKVSTPYTDLKRPSVCSASATGNNNQAVDVRSMYGFLIVSTGGSADDVSNGAFMAQSGLQ